MKSLTQFKGFLILWLTASVMGSPGPLAAAEKSEIKWIKGPAKADLQTTAEIQVPAGYKFADGKDTRRMLRAVGEPVSDREQGMMMPEDGGWTVFFEYSEDGYVKDDDKDKLNADKLLDAIKKGNEYGNEERKKNGHEPLNIVGWEKPPFYDTNSHNLEWAIRAEAGGRPILNYNTRILGRHGVMEVVLVCSPDKLESQLPKFRELLAGYHYKVGERYAEYRSGDKLAKYGLAALITGGAVAVAAKTGLLAGALLLLKKGWKLLVVGLVAVVGLVKRLLFGPSGRSDE